jgi:hypothetical protein
MEPQQGRFDFSIVDAIVSGAREHGLHVVLLWFATWKNGTCDYVPEWIKNDPDTYPLMRDRSGASVRVLSPYGEKSCQADTAAFAALMQHIKELDEEQNTVIMVQVQNEPGSLFTDRDYSESAQKQFEKGLPADLQTALELDASDWNDAFPRSGNEAFNAWAVARYVNSVAKAGREAYDGVPLTVNVWLKERKGFMRPGQEYPSGIPVSHMLDLWKFATPDIDIIGPDIYVQDYVGYREVCRTYARPDNPLLIPETGGNLAFACYLFYALGDFGAIGWAPFGVDRADSGVELREGLDAVRASYALLAPAAAEIAQLQQRGTLCAAVEEQLVTCKLLQFEDFEALVEFGRPIYGYGGLSSTGNRELSGRVLVGARTRNEFMVMGFDARLSFRSTSYANDNTQFICVEQGHFEDGQWCMERRLNGDQTFFGLHLPAQGACYRVEVRALAS